MPVFLHNETLTLKLKVYVLVKDMPIIKKEYRSYWDDYIPPTAFFQVCAKTNGTTILKDKCTHLRDTNLSLGPVYVCPEHLF